MSAPPGAPPNPSWSRGGSRALHPPHTCKGWGSWSPWAPAGSSSAQQRETRLRRFKKKKNRKTKKSSKMCWFQVTSGCFWIPFSPSPKSVAQKSQPGSVQATDLYFPVLHLVQGKQASLCWQMWLGQGFLPHLHLCPGSCSPWGSLVSLAG